MIVASCALPGERRAVLEQLSHAGIPVRVSSWLGNEEDLLLVHSPQVARNLRRLGVIEAALCSLGAAREAASLGEPAILLVTKSLWAGVHSTRPESPVNLHVYVARLLGARRPLLVVVDKHFPRGTVEFAGGETYVAALYSASEGAKVKLMVKNSNLLLLPMPPGASDGTFARYVDVLGEYADALDPDVTVIGIGTDLHYRDVQGEHFVSEWGYARLVERLGRSRAIVVLECAAPGNHTVSIMSTALDVLRGRRHVDFEPRVEESAAVREESSRVLRLVRRIMRDRTSM